MCDIKGGNVFVVTTKVFFSGGYGLCVLPLSLQSAIDNCPCRSSRFLESLYQTIETLANNPQQITKFLAIQLIRCHVGHSENLLHQSILRFTTTVTSDFCAVAATIILYVPRSWGLNCVGGLPCVSMHY